MKPDATPQPSPGMPPGLAAQALSGRSANVDVDAAAPRAAPRAAPAGRGGRPLSIAQLDALPRHVGRPRFDVRALRPGILHLGCGAFHRAHQVVMTQRAIEAETLHRSSPPPWGIVAASLRSSRFVPALKRQQGIYTVVEHGPQVTRAEVTGALREPLHAVADADRLARWLVHPQMRLMTLTVTESGYCAQASSGRLDENDPEVRADLTRPWPRSVPGLLVKGLALRRKAGAVPPVMLSCDNLAGNGRLLRQVCVDMAALRGDDGLASWIERHAQFPSSMVDRIVPVTTDADRAQAAQLTGAFDEVPVTTEPFCQWVIERFDGPRPLWEAGGAEFVADVRPWEASKLRLLNGGHLALACLGLLAGRETVAEALTEPMLATYALRLLIDEQRPTLPPSDHDIHAYARQLVERWRNPGIAHRLERVGRNASGKLPSRLLAGLRSHLAVGRTAPLTLLAVAGWIWCASGHDARGKVLLAEDHLRDTLRRIGQAAGREPARLVRGFLGVHEVFGDDLARHPAVVTGLTKALTSLQRQGAVGAVRTALQRAHAA